MKKVSVIIGLVFVSMGYLFGQLTPKGVEGPAKGVEDPVPVVIQWISLEEALERAEVEPRKIIVDVYTEWCTWCDKMEEVTFQDQKIAQFINENFYAVKFDAELKKEILFKDKSYGFSKNGKREYHDLAKELMGGRFSFPTVVFLDENQDLIQCVVGFKTPSQFEKISSYFAEDHYRKIPWSSFQERYQRVVDEKE